MADTSNNGIERLSKGHQKAAKGRPTYIKNKNRKKVSVPSANGRGWRGAHLEFVSTFGATWSIWALDFGAR